MILSNHRWEDKRAEKAADEAGVQGKERKGWTTAWISRHRRRNYEIAATVSLGLFALWGSAVVHLLFGILTALQSQ